MPSGIWGRKGGGGGGKGRGEGIREGVYHQTLSALLQGGRLADKVHINRINLKLVPKGEGQ